MLVHVVKLSSQELNNISYVATTLVLIFFRSAGIVGHRSAKGAHERGKERDLEGLEYKSPEESMQMHAIHEDNQPEK
jgi:hypothetical protein